MSTEFMEMNDYEGTFAHDVSIASQKGMFGGSVSKTPDVFMGIAGIRLDENENGTFTFTYRSRKILVQRLGNTTRTTHLTGGFVVAQFSAQGKVNWQKYMAQRLATPLGSYTDINNRRTPKGELEFFYIACEQDATAATYDASGKGDPMLMYARVGLDGSRVVKPIFNYKKRKEIDDLIPGNLTSVDMGELSMIVYPKKNKIIIGRILLK